jgi:hypothetical protein
MSKGLEKRLSRVEQQLAERTEEPIVCNCRYRTHFHNADCLDALLKQMPRVCPLHGFRQLGFLMWTPKWYRLWREDNRFCPCPPHPWRSFVLSEGPHTREGQKAAREAWDKLPPDDNHNFREDNRTTDAETQYYEARQQWLEKMARPEERRRLELKRRKMNGKRARKHVG